MDFSMLIIMMFLASILTYALSKANIKMGAYSTVAFSVISLAILFLGKKYIGNEFSISYLTFKVTTVGWYFSLIMVLIYSMTSFFNPYWMEKLIYPSSYNFLYLFSLAGTVGLFFSRDLITLFVFWEIVVWSSTFIVPLGKSRRASVVYYTISSVGSMFTLFAIMFVYSKSGTFVISDAFKFLANEPMTATIIFFVFIMAGLTKIGIFPFHIWLPLAHGNAPHTFSPVLSGGLVKMGAFIAYLAVGVMPVYTAFSNSLSIMGVPFQIYLLLVLGAISIVLGTLMAIKQEDAKKLIAYSSVANGGYILIGIVLMDQLTFAGAMMHLFNHAIASAAAFLTIAAIAHRTGTTKISELGGMIHKMPVSYVVYLISIISLAGIPPMGGFVSKWLIIQGLASKGLIFISFAAFFGSIGSFLYVFRPLAGLFLGQLAPKYEDIKPSTLFMKIPMVILAFMSIFYGVLPRFILNVIAEIEISVGIAPVVINGNTIVALNGILNSYNVFIIFGFGFLISLAIFLLLPKSRKVGLMDTFTSAEFIYTPELYHYAHSFYAPFERIYEKHPSVEKFINKFGEKTDEFGKLVNSLFFSHKPSITVFWMMLIMTLIFLGGVSI